MMAKRKIIAELVAGVEAMKKQREGKLTLRSYQVEAAPLPAVNSKLVRETRKCGVRGRYLHGSCGSM